MELLTRLLLLPVQALKREGTALIVMWFVFLLPASARADAGAQGSLSASEEPKYLIFWGPAEQAAELAQRIGVKGDGKTRLLGFGLPTSTYELEDQLPNRIRSGSAVGKLMEGVPPLAAAGKLDELEKLLDQALEMLGETEDAPDVYGQE